MEEFVFKIAYCCELIISINFAILTMTNTMIGDTISWYQSPISSLKLCCGICFIMPCCLLVAPVSRVGLWFLQGQSLVFFQLMLIEGVSLYHLHQVHSVLYSEYHFNCSLYPCFDEVERGVYWYHLVRLSVCPSVDRIVSALYLQQYSSDPFHICTSYQATSEGVSRVMPVSKLKNLKFWRIF